MTHRQTKHAMNLAIDRLLDTDARDALDEHLDHSPDDALLWHKMQRVDRTLRGAAQVAAPAGFSARLMAALAAGRGPQTDPRLGIGIAVGLMLAAFVTIPVLGGLLLLALSLILNTTAIQTALAGLSRLGSALSAVLATFVTQMGTLVATNPLMPILSMAALGTLAMFWRMTWVQAVRYAPVTYQIPVRVVAS